ncbi:MAG TPA: YceH family protein [Burkholderiaceae bacterium]
MSLPTLSLLETRILGVLVEKQHTVPDTYPLSLNALTAGCNQKTARDPVIAASEGDVLAALDTLRSLNLVFEGSGSRVPRYEHNTGRVLGVPSQSVALLATLMLRGPQTAAELRQNSERLHRFADISSVEGFLDELATHEPPYVARLARAPGAREARWAHLLSGTPAEVAPTAATGAVGTPLADAGLGLSEIAAMRAEQLRMNAEIGRLRAQVERLAKELGVDLDGDPPAAP